MDNKFSDYKIFYLQEVNSWALKKFSNEENNLIHNEIKLRITRDMEQVGIVMEISEKRPSEDYGEETVKNIKPENKESENQKIGVVGYLSKEDSQPYLPYLKKNHADIYDGFILEFDKKAYESRMVKLLIYIKKYNENSEVANKRMMNKEVANKRKKNKRKKNKRKRTRERRTR